MPIELTIVTPQGESFSGEVERVVLPGSEGDFGVLQGHERFLAPLRVGPVEIQDHDGTHYAAVAEGFADVGGEEVVVMVGRCERAEAIDRTSVEQERDQARTTLGSLGGSEDDLVRRTELEAQIARADVWLDVAGR